MKPDFATKKRQNEKNSFGIFIFKNPLDHINCSVMATNNPFYCHSIVNVSHYRLKIGLCLFLLQIGLSVGDVNRILQSAKMEQHAMQVGSKFYLRTRAWRRQVIICPFSSPRKSVQGHAV